MNLDMGILWIEDSFDKEEEANLRRRIMDAGFVARIETIPNGDGLKELARRNALFHCYDFVLLDFKLKNVEGDELAPVVRELFPSTTILFYSGNFPEEELRARIADKQVEGVYCSHRDRFIDRTGMLIDQAARALDRLSGMRGLAMRVVAECDAIMKATVLALTQHDPNCEAQMRDMDNDVFGHMEQARRAYEEAADADLAARLATYAVDSAKLFKHFRRLSRTVAKNPEEFGLLPDQVDELRALTADSKQYTVDVLGRRNALGHANEVASDQGWKLDGNSGIVVADFPSIRRDFANYIDMFRRVANLVTPVGQQPQ